MHSTKYDVVVAGAGIVGLAHAWMASRKGLRVAVLEKNHRCIGASVRNFGFITVTGQRAGDTWRRAMRSRQLWAEVAPKAGIPICHQGLIVVGQRFEALEILESFQQTEMGQDCSLLSAETMCQRFPEIRSEHALGGLYSPQELRVESKDAIGQLAMWLSQEMGVDFFFGHELLEINLPQLRTASNIFHTEKLILCPGTELSGIAEPYLAPHRLTHTQLQMLRIQPSRPLPLHAAVMSDLSLVRYAGYTGLNCHQALLDRLLLEEKPSLDAGIHLIAVQSEDGSLVVGDSHHPVSDVEPFAQESVDMLILDQLQRTILLDEYRVTHRWTGKYPVDQTDNDALIISPNNDIRVVSVISGTGASTAFGIAEEVIDQWGI
ncbi:TIGR03364 family FAD-dependent oxidoreductase [Zwartia panacis]|uniref:TIGR03364 family FAD-dependent oxidoreductase n=1 Tax=Zwartia panacis TaxID=2683345 RepID=UPI0025B5DA8A|nr:TIGR03364 family FAD-dependent oxidoreductase [Zwartia panacis]MDN4017777.1 TIGR03364 family FAD-dependent oxidoreductase [Zwartia panacis]